MPALDSRPRNAGCRALRLKKDKAKSTVFLVAQICSAPLPKSSVAMLALRRKLQKNKKWQMLCY